MPKRVTGLFWESCLSCSNCGSSCCFPEVADCFLQCSGRQHLPPIPGAAQAERVAPCPIKKQASLHLPLDYPTGPGATLYLTSGHSPSPTEDRVAVEELKGRTSIPLWAEP